MLKNRYGKKTIFIKKKIIHVCDAKCENNDFIKLRQNYFLSWFELLCAENSVFNSD